MTIAVHHPYNAALDLPRRLAPSSRDRIVAAATDLLRTEPEKFSVQRAARLAGISARAVYGHFESGIELVHAAHLSMLKTINANLPVSVPCAVSTEDSLRQFAHSVACALQPDGAVLLPASRQDESLRLEYQRLLRRPLIHALEIYIRQHRSVVQPIACSHAKLAELLVTTIEATVVSYDPRLALKLSCAETLNELVRSVCAANGIGWGCASESPRSSSAQLNQ